MSLSYKIKTIKEDFIVNEVFLEPHFLNKDKSEFTYIWMEKRGLTTFDALEKICGYFNLNHEDLSYQGLKDEDGITYQLVSIKKIIEEKEILRFNGCFSSRNCGLQFSRIIGYGNKPVIQRFLHGNIFKLVIRNLSAKKARSFFDFCLSNRFITFINYYDSQRFGIVDRATNSHLIGKAIIDGNWQEAYRQLKRSGNSGIDNLKFTSGCSSAKYKEIFQRLNFAKVNFFVSSYNSWLWNKAVSQRFKKERCSGKFIFPKIGELSLPCGAVFKSENTFSIAGYEIERKNIDRR